jgi:hypothetical protein
MVRRSDQFFGRTGSGFTAWAVGNAKVEPKGNAIVITKQASGTAKTDPLIAFFNAVALMSMNSEAAAFARSISGLAVYEVTRKRSLPVSSWIQPLPRLRSFELRSDTQGENVGGNHHVGECHYALSGEACFEYRVCQHKGNSTGNPVGSAPSGPTIGRYPLYSAERLMPAV